MSNGIDVRNVDASFIVQGNRIHSGGRDLAGVYVLQAGRASIRDNVIGTSEFGIRADNSRAIAITGNLLSANGHAIYLAGSADSTLEANLITSSGYYGIAIEGSDNASIVGNTLSNDANGIVIGGSTNATLRANRLTSEGLYIDGGPLRYYNTHTIPPDNLVNAKPLYYHKDCTDLSVDSLPVGELIVANCKRIRVTNLNIADTDLGIEMVYVTEATLTTNRLTENDIGVSIESSRNIFLSQNDATRNGHGFWLRNLADVTLVSNNLSTNIRGMRLDVSENAILLANRVASNRETGINLGPGVRNLRMGGNVAQDNEWGVYVDGVGSNLSFVANDVSNNRMGGMNIGSTNVTVIGNRVASNRNYGIVVAYGAATVITDNTITNSGRGIYLYGRPMGPTGVLVHHNRIMDNGVQGSDDQGPENAWDNGYPSGGNWWSDYGGVDACSGPNQDICPSADGIGDTPYVLDADSGDRYPLMSPPPTQNTPPVAVATVSPGSQGNLGTTFAFDGKASWDPEGPIAAYRWEFGDGTNASGSIARHRYAARGSFTVTLTASDPEGLTDTIAIGIQVLNRAPIANAGPDAIVREETVVALDGTRSSDPDGDGLTYAWLQIEGPSLILSGPNTARPTFAPTHGGVYRFELAVADGYGGSARDTVTIVVEAQGKAGEPVAIPVLAWSVIILAVILALLIAAFFRRRRKDET